MKRNFSLILAALLILSLSFGLTACKAEQENTDTGKLKIIATIFPQYDFARQIAGDKAQVKMLISPGTESHSFEPTTSDIMDINNCDIFIYTGGDSDSWIDDLLNNTNNPDMTVISLMDCVDILCSEDEHKEHEEHEHNHSHVDEHVWTSPVNAIDISEEICAQMCLKDPDNAEFYTENLQNYLEDLSELDAQFREITSTAQRNILIFADRFPLKYFAEEYSLEYRAAFSGCSDDTEPSAREIASIIDIVREENYPVIFKIELSSDSIANTIREETDAEVLTFYSCHNISKEDFDKGETYLSLMQRNADSLKAALN